MSVNATRYSTRIPVGYELMNKLTDYARYLASHAMAGRVIYYTDMSDEFGLGSPQNCRNPLQAVMRWCNKNELPDLSVIVISKAESKPTYHSERWSESEVVEEQRRVFEYPWGNIFRTLG